MKQKTKPSLDYVLSFSQVDLSLKYSLTSTRKMEIKIASQAQEEKLTRLWIKMRDCINFELIAKNF